MPQDHRQTLVTGGSPDSGFSGSKRALRQARGFGAEVSSPVAMTALPEGEGHLLELSGGGPVWSRAVILTAGVTYLRLGTELIEARGEGRLRSLLLRNLGSDVTEEVPAHALSLFIGAAPQTDWLPEKLRSPAGWFETSLPGVYAAGDIRSGSIKGVAASAGEGAMVAQLVRRSLSGVPGSPVRQLERVLA